MKYTRLWILTFAALLAKQIEPAANPTLFLEAPPKRHVVVCGVYSTEADAQSAAEQIAAQGVGPTSVRETEAKHAVEVGIFDNHPEAWQFADELSAMLQISARVRSEDNEARAQFSTNAHGLPPLVLPAGEPVFEPVLDLVHDSNTTAELAELQGILADQGLESGIALLNRAIAGLQDSDTRKAALSNQLAKCLVRKTGESAPALPSLLRVAQQEVAATEQDLIEARFLVADSWHYYWFRPLKAYRAYNEIYDTHGADDAVRARCRVEMAACLLELARMYERPYRASFDEARRACALIQHEVPPEFRRAHAVAELMYNESWYFEATDRFPPGTDERKALYAISLERFAGFEHRHPGRTREIAMAKQMRSDMLAENERYAEAAKNCREIIAMDFTDPDENFYWMGERWDLKQNAAKRLVTLAQKQGDNAALAEWTAYLTGKHHLDDAPALPLSFNLAFPHEFYSVAAE